MKTRNNLTRIWLDLIVLIVIGILFVVPFVFIFLTASKTQQEAALFEFSWPDEFQLFQNLSEVMTFADNRMLLALRNSTILTVGSVILIVLLGASVAFVLQRRNDRVASIAGILMLLWGQQFLDWYLA